MALWRTGLPQWLQAKECQKPFPACSCHHLSPNWVILDVSICFLSSPFRWPWPCIISAQSLVPFNQVLLRLKLSRFTSVHCPCSPLWCPWSFSGRCLRRHPWSSWSGWSLNRLWLSHRCHGNRHWLWPSHWHSAGRLWRLWLILIIAIFTVVIAVI